MRGNRIARAAVHVTVEVALQSGLVVKETLKIELGVNVRVVVGTDKRAHGQTHEDTHRYLDNT